VARLERGQRCRCADGIYTVVAVLLRYPGEPEPEIPADAPRCSRYGEPHPLFEVLISSRAEVEAFQAESAS
jgi:hypothetical protein